MPTHGRPRIRGEKVYEDVDREAILDAASKPDEYWKDYFVLPEYQLDYSKEVLGKDVDRGVIQKKIAMYDYAMRAALVGKNKYATRILNDVSIRAHALFRLNDAAVVPYYYQDVIMSDMYRYRLFCSANQTGKSLTLDIEAACNFLQDHHKEWVGILVSNSLQQSTYQMLRIKSLLQTAKVNYKEEVIQLAKSGKLDSKMAISFTFWDQKVGKQKYRNLLVCCPPSNSALGYPCDEIWLDEFDYWTDIDHDYFMNQIAIPRTISTKGRITVFSNPNGKSYLYKLWNEKIGDKHKWHRYRFNYWDKIDATEDEYKTITSGMTRQQIESTMLALFSDPKGAYFSYDDIRHSHDQRLEEQKEYIADGKTTFWFLDVASKHDQSVLTGCYTEPDKVYPDMVHFYIFYIKAYPVGYPLSRMVGVFDESQATDGWHYEKSVREILDDNSVQGLRPCFGCDVTGNAGIAPLFQQANIAPVEVRFTGPGKSAMYQRLKYVMENKMLSRVRCMDDNGNDMFENQFLTLQCKGKSKAGYLMFHHESEEDLDDINDSVAGVLNLADKPMEITPSILRF